LLKPKKFLTRSEDPASAMFFLHRSCWLHCVQSIIFIMDGWCRCHRLVMDPAIRFWHRSRSSHGECFLHCRSWWRNRRVPPQLHAKPLFNIVFLIIFKNWEWILSGGGGGARTDYVHGVDVLVYDLGFALLVFEGGACVGFCGLRKCQGKIWKVYGSWIGSAKDFDLGITIHFDCWTSIAEGMETIKTLPVVAWWTRRSWKWGLVISTKDGTRQLRMPYACCGLVNLDYLWCRASVVEDGVHNMYLTVVFGITVSVVFLNIFYLKIY